MSATVATVLCVIGILGLFFLDRERESRPSKALWIPVVWMLIVGSRPVSQWLNVQSNIESASQMLEGSPLDASVFTILLILGLIVLVGRSKEVLSTARRNGPILLFFGYCLISVLWSDFPDVAFKRWIKDFGDLVMVVICLTDPNPAAALMRLSSRLSFILIPLSALFIKYYPTMGRTYSPFTGEASNVGITMNKQGLGMVALILGLSALWQLFELLRRKDTPHRWRHVVAQGVLLLAVVWILGVAHSLTSTACFAIGGCIIVATSLFRFCRKPSVIHLIVGVALAVSLSSTLLNPGGDLVQSTGKDATLTGRLEIWKLVLNIPANRFVGTGFESFWLGGRLEKIWSIYWWHTNQAHNGYIEVLLNLGWVGIALLALLLIKGYRNIIDGMRRQPETHSIRLAHFTAIIIFGITEAVFRMLSFTWILLLLQSAARVNTGVAETHLAVKNSDSRIGAKRDAVLSRDLLVSQRHGAI